MALVPTHGVADAGAARVAAVVSRHERTLLQVARRASLCDDDANDAYQRALEIFIRRVDTVDPATELAWLRVVTSGDATQEIRSRPQRPPRARRLPCGRRRSDSQLAPS